MTITLLVVQGKPAGKRLAFPLGDYFFGRGVECQVRPNSEWVSRQHCRLRVTSGGAYLRDLGSRNGTLVNGVLLAGDQLLCAGDQIQIGPLVFEVQLASADEKPAPKVKPCVSADLESPSGHGPGPGPVEDTHIPALLPPAGAARGKE